MYEYGMETSNDKSKVMVTANSKVWKCTATLSKDDSFPTDIHIRIATVATAMSRQSRVRRRHQLNHKVQSVQVPRGSNHASGMQNVVSARRYGKKNPAIGVQMPGETAMDLVQGAQLTIASASTHALPPKTNINQGKNDWLLTQR